MSDKPAIGIDLGTTYSCIAVCRDGRVEVLENEQGNRITPSCVSFTDSAVLVGEEAKLEMPLNPKNTVYDSKRLIGRLKIDDTVRADMNLWPFEVIEENRIKIKVKYKNADKTLYPEQISSQILRKMKEIAELRLKTKICDVVITVPAYFRNSQRQATKDAATIAGLNVMRIINEPTAASLAFGIKKEKSQNVLIYDLGGGTFDVTIFSITDGVFQVRATKGDAHLGGQDFTNKLVEYCLKEIKNKDPNINLSDEMMTNLKINCDRAKIALSELSLTNVIFNYGDTITIPITRACFENLNKDAFQRTLYFVNKALFDAKMDKSIIDEIVLVGGSTRILKIRNMLSEYFNGKDINISMNPDECVAHGAAIQAAMINNYDSDYFRNIVLLDVTPIPLGIKTVGGLMSVIVERNSVIPLTKQHQYTTQKSNQSGAFVEIFEGERYMADDNLKLDEFIIEDLPKAMSGGLIIVLEFEIDINGILTVTAIEKSSSKKISKRVKYGMDKFSPEDIKKMIDQAQQFQEDDVSRKATAELRNRLETLCLQIESDCAYNIHKLSESEKVLVLRKTVENLDYLKHSLRYSVEEFERRYNDLESFYKEYKK